MKAHPLPLILMAATAAGTQAIGMPRAFGDDDVKTAAVKKPTFAKPVRLMSGGAPVSTEAPGYASPAWYDVNGDGRADLVVGQFNGGKMMAYHQAPDGTLGEGSWLMAGGEVAEVPGVW